MALFNGTTGDGAERGGRLADLRALGRLSALLARLSKQPDAPQPDPLLRERLGLTSETGTSFDLFEPRADHSAPLVALHGCTLKGRADPRLQHFSRCVARAGRSVYVPTLAGLADAQWRPEDVEDLVLLVAEIHHRTRQPVDLIGFSFSASYALVAAAEPRIADKVRHVLGFGAYCSFVDTYRYLIDCYSREQVPDAEWDDHIYMHLITAYRQREQLGLSEPLVDGIVSLLRRYCHPATPQEKRAFFEDQLRHLDALTTERAHLDWDALRALSPAGKLGGLRCPVYLVHDPQDPLVPPAQAQQLLEELRQRSEAPDARLLFTTMLQHVSLTDVFNVGELRRLLSTLLPLIVR